VAVGEDIRGDDNHVPDYALGRKFTGVDLGFNGFDDGPPSPIRRWVVLSVTHMSSAYIRG
jgi:hypothetical protein